MSKMKWDWDQFDNFEIVPEKKTPNKNKFKASPKRNDKCPCGSGLKYKNCCMQLDKQIIEKL